jgi:sortase A
VLPTEPIVRPDTLPGAAGQGDSLSAEARVIPVPTGGSTLVPQYPPRRLVVPSIGVDSKIIVLGTKLNRDGDVVWETAPFAVGYHRGTGTPGQIGNMVLSGHISSPNEGAVFRNLPKLGIGEGVILFTDERSYLYRVEQTRVVEPSEVSVMDATGGAIATLITCVPDGIYTQRLVVSARLVS